jgi:hypothetical protein
MKALLVVCFCSGVVLGQQIGQDGYPSQLSQPIGNLPDPNPREATERDLPQVPRTLVTTIHMVLEDGGPPSRTPDMHSSSCGSYSMRPGGVATLVSYNGSGGCSASISLPGFQTLRVETAAVHHPVTVTIRRIGADVDGVAEGPISASMLAMPAAAHKAYGEGEIAMGLGHWVDAAGWFRKAVAEYPAHMLAWDELGLALQKLNQTADGKAAWEKALLADPTFARASIHLAILAIQEQRPADAAELTARALRAPGPDERLLARRQLPVGRPDLSYTTIRCSRSR